jgi:hypothetical protein
MLALSLIFLFAMYENIFYKKVNKSKTKFFDYSVIFLYTSFFFMIIGLLYSAYFNHLDLIFLTDYRFWVYIMIELVGMYSMNINYINNPNNHTAINVGIFSTVLLTPFVVYFLDNILEFNNTIHVSMFNNITNILIFSFIYLLIGSLYFIPKKILHPLK